MKPTNNNGGDGRKRSREARNIIVQEVRKVGERVETVAGGVERVETRLEEVIDPLLRALLALLADKR